MHWLPLLFAAILIPGVAAAQAATIAPLASSVDHTFLTDRTGWLVNVDVPLLDRQLYLRVQLESSGGAGDHSGTVCDPPGGPGCVEESIDDRSWFRSMSLAVPVHLVARPRIAFAVIPHLIGGRVSIHMTGRSTGEELRSFRNYRGVGIGAELLLRSAAASQFSLVVGARHASLSPVRTQNPDVVQLLSREFYDNAGYAGLRIGR